MSDSASSLPVAATGDIIRSQPRSGLRRRFWAAFLSAVVPGAGQFLMSRRRKGTVLLLIFMILLLCVWPLRLPRFFVPFILLILGWIVLSFYAVCTALFQDRDPSEQRTPKWLFVMVPLLSYVGLNVVFTPIFLATGFRALKFASSSMEDTLVIGDQFFIDTTFYRKHPVKHNDLVVLRRKDYQTVKRVVAIGGDTIEGKNRNIIVNGQSVTEPFTRHSLAPGTNAEMDSFGPLIIPRGKYFVMGDNRDISLDSRLPEFGLLDGEAITGKPLYIYRSPVKGRRGRKLD